MLQLVSRKIAKTVETEANLTILELALKYGVDWGFFCTRGTCARCRFFTVEGIDQLNLPTDAERERLEPEEIERGYRLGCQAMVIGKETVKVLYKPYF